MLWALLGVVSAALLFCCWCWRQERRIRIQLGKALVIMERACEAERESYKQLVAVFNERTVGATLKHKTERIPRVRRQVPDE